MHLEGPWLSTTGKRKGKTKFRNAEEAARYRQLTAEWEKLMQSNDTKAKVKNKVESVLNFSNTNVLNKAMNLAYSELLGDADLLNKEEEIYANITAEDLQQTAKKYFNQNNAVTLHYLMNKA